MGYAGGEMPDPTYRRLGGHTETIQIEFDPTRIRYEELLAIFWQSHNPSSRRPRQYRSIVFYHDEAQRRAAEQSRDALAESGRLGGPVATGSFTDAEGRPINDS